MKTLLIATAALLGSIGFAHAADMPVKAVSYGFGFGTQGWYVGIGTLAATTNSEISIPAVGTTGQITTAGAGVGPVFGYQKGDASSFKAIEAAVYWQNLGGTQLNTGASVNARFSSSARIKFGGTAVIATLGQLLPNLGLGGVFPPASTLGQNSLPYFSIGADVNQVQASVIGIENKGWQVTPTFGMGFISQVMDPVTGKPTGFATDTSIEYTPAGKGMNIGTNGNANLGRKFIAKFSVLK